MQSLSKLKNPFPEIKKLLDELENRMKKVETSVYEPEIDYVNTNKIYQFKYSDFEELSIRDWNGKLIPFTLNDSQKAIIDKINEQLRDNVPVRLDVLKSRKHGCSTLLAAVVYILIRDFHFRATIIGQEIRAAENLYKMVRLFHSKDPNGGKKPEIRNKRELIFKEGGEIWVATADTDNLERSQSNQVLLCTEYAFWPNPEKQMTALLDTVASTPMTFVFIESTANGVDNDFHRRWLEAESGFDDQKNPSDWKPIFLPWTGLEWNKTYFKNDKHREMFINTLKNDEKKLLDEGITLEQLNWRRMKIASYSGRDWSQKIKSFWQEHPISSDEAFLNTGRTKFDVKGLRKWYEDAKKNHPPIFVGDMKSWEGGLHWNTFAKDLNAAQKEESQDKEQAVIDMCFAKNPEGEFRVWEWPEPYENYDFGADVSLGVQKTDGSNDASAFHVFKKSTRTVVMTYKSECTPPEEYASVLACVGLMYGTAYNCTECNNMGNTTLVELAKIYPDNRIYWSKRGQNVAYQEDSERRGFWTNEQTKTKILNRLAYVIRYNKIKLYDLETIAELTRIVIDPNGRVETKGRDLTMALALTLEAYADDKADYNKQPATTTYDEEYAAWRRSVAERAAFNQLMRNPHPIDNGMWEIEVA